MNDLKVCWWPIEKIFPYSKNARKIPQSAIDKVAASLCEYGWQQPIVVEPNGTIIVGHVRRLGALQNGWTEAPVVVAEIDRLNVPVASPAWNVSALNCTAVPVQVPAL